MVVLKVPSKGHSKVNMMYTRHLRLKKKRDSINPTPLPHLQPNQTIKSNNDNKLKPKCTLTHSKNMYIKVRIIAWSIIMEFSKALRFLSFHEVQNNQKGAVF